TLIYAANLVPDISDDVVNVDRAMRWGFAWNQGPFEMLDALGPNCVIEKIRSEGGQVPKMLKILEQAGVTQFYKNNGIEYLGIDGAYHSTPTE
ncbi:MAG: 3-hydroxyacyl-CoA dehydrogenase, partial [Rhodospirillales bacterium]